MSQEAARPLFLSFTETSDMNSPSLHSELSAEQAVSGNLTIACKPLLMARRTDPATSHAAAAKATRFANSHASRILAALVDKAGTAHQIAERTGLSVVQIDRRLPELAAAGRARVVLTVTGEPLVRGGARVWELC